MSDSIAGNTVQAINNINQAEGDPTVIGSEIRNINVKFVQALDKEIDKFVADLKHSMLSQQGQKRGVWDRMKGWWSNVWRGRYNQNNPEYWRNRLGDDLGGVSTESTGLSMGLKEFHTLKQLAGDLERQVNTLNEDMSEIPLPKGTASLRIMSVIDNWANRFKKAVHQLANDRLGIDLKNLGATETPPPAEMPAEVPSQAPTATEKPQAPTTKGKPQEPTDAPEDDPVSNGLDQVTPPDDVDEPVDNVDEPESNVDEPVDNVDEPVNNTNPAADSSVQQQKEEEPVATNKGPYDPGEPEDGDGTEQIGDMELSRKQIEIMRLKAQADWKNMTSEERAEYDERGGGVWKAAGQKKFNISSSTHTYKAGIHSLPFFLTKSDPRYWILLGLPTRHYFDAMARHGQIDGISYVKEASGRKAYSAAPTLDGNPKAIQQRINQIKNKVEDSFSQTSTSRSAAWETRRSQKDPSEQQPVTRSEPVGPESSAKPADVTPKSQPSNEPTDQVNNPLDQVSGEDDPRPEPSTAQVTEPKQDKEEGGMSEEDRAEIEDALSKLDQEKNKPLIDAAREMMKSGMFSKSDILDSLPDEDNDEFADDGFFDSYKALGKVLMEMSISERKEHLKSLLRKENKRLLPSKLKMKNMSWEEKVEYLREQIHA